MLLVEIMNADEKSKTDLSTEQGQARDLLETNRLLRVSSSRSSDPEVAGVLDELERVLVEVANGPSEMSERELQQLQQRIQSQGLLFKVRVCGLENVPGTPEGPLRAECPQTAVDPVP